MKNKVKKLLKKQHYYVVGEHSAVQICRWTKKSLRDEGVCYKEKFYGIKSSECCQMSPSVMWCQNQCLHCWRAIENTLGIKIDEEDSPKEIIEECIKGQRVLLSGFKGSTKTNKEKWQKAQNPTQFAISLSGEPTIYSKIAELIKELRKQGKSTFLVTNGLKPERLLELEKKKALPTQLYISLNAPNKKMYGKWHRSSDKKAWEKFNRSLEIMKKLRKKTRTVVRMTLVKDLNMKQEYVPEYAKLILKAQPDFVEVKGFMSVGYARKRLGYERMPSHKEIKEFSKLLLRELKNSGYKFLDEQIASRVVLLGNRNKSKKIKKGKI